MHALMLDVLSAYWRGDLSVRMPDVGDGIFGDMARMLNQLIERNQAVSSELQRVGMVVGQEGRLMERAYLDGLSGAWAQQLDTVNFIITELARPTKEVGRVMQAVAAGDLSQKITGDAKGEILEVKNTINTMVDTLRSFASEVTRVAREVGTEGRLGVQADVKGVTGTWKDLTDNVNVMAANLTVQLRDVSKVATAIANGDLTQKITVDVRGEILQIKDVINKMVDTLRSFSAEVTRVAREVGTEGKLGGQADVKGVAGTWKDLTDNVNAMATNLTVQLRDVSKVATAIANGDLTQKITVDVKGEILQIKEVINKMVDQLNAFAAEVTRVAREVGTEGKLGGQADVRGVSGTWKDLTDKVNSLTANLTAQVRNIAKVTTAVANGDLTQKITVDVRGEILELKNTINVMVDQLSSFASEVTRVAKEVGTEGKLGGQAEVKGVSGTWKDLTDNVNFMAANLTKQVRGIVKVVTAVAEGDLTTKFVLEAKGEVAALAETINSMTDTLRIFADQVTTVAREVGIEGKLGAQARVPGVSGTWKDLTDNVNAMAANLTVQLRDVSKVATAIANGDLGQKITVDVRGEILQIKDVINKMVDTLRIFADQVTTVAREVGIEGKLGGQAKVPGAAGTWRDLTDNVNAMAANLTTQVRAIAEVATAVTTGDLTRQITVEAQGEVAQLKDNINQMIDNLRDTTITNKEQDWLKTNLAKFSSMMQGQRSIESLSRLIMSELTPVVGAQYGAFYVLDGEGDRGTLKLVSSYAYQDRKQLSNRFAIGQGLVGQVALEKKYIRVTSVPEDYVNIVSGLGQAAPRNIVVFPVLFEGNLKAVIELGSFAEFSPIHFSFLDQLMQSIGVVFNMIGASMRTEELLNELQRSNQELEGRSKELEDKAEQLEIKNTEIAKASASLEEKARELSQISKYKSDFLANMSHELRTPLNSLLILAKMLAENEETTLTPKQVEFARTIYSSGNDLLALINEILDLSKIEAGKMHIEVQEVPLNEVRMFVERSFGPMAQQKGLAFQVRIKQGTPASIITDGYRLNQILKNLLSNAFKFTEQGSIGLDVSLADKSMRFRNPVLNQAGAVLAFTVTDSGIGIPKDKQMLVFEAFQQADTTTARKYGGTGLGLTISRELARLLGGELGLKSTVGQGSSFTLYLPVSHEGVEWSMPDARGFGGHAGATAVDMDEAQKAVSGKRALLIDDDPRNLYAITSLLERSEMKVVTVSNGRDALELLRKSPRDFDLVLTDIVMPGMDGYELTREIRAMSPASGASKLPIIAFSGKIGVGEHHLCMEMGCSDFVSNPADADQLFSAIYRNLQTDEAPSEPSRSTPGTYSAAHEEEPVGVGPKVLEGRRLLLVDDDPRNLFAVASFLESRGGRVTAVDNAPEGIEILRKDPRFDIVLMDIMMPDLDGYEATRQIRQLGGAYERLPIIAVTAKAMAEDRRKAHEAGCDDFVAKPVKNGELLATIQRHLSRAQEASG